MKFSEVSENVFRPDTEVKPKPLNRGVYQAMGDMSGFYLVKLEDSFKVPNKIYGSNGKNIAPRIINAVKAKGKTGVLFSGSKGNGKTLTAKHVANETGYPIICVTTDFTGPGFFNFLTDISKETPIVLFFDEFEKVYRENSQQESLLTFFDGSYDFRGVFLLTVNGKVNQYFVNRLSRIRYGYHYSTLSVEVASEIIDDLLEDKSHKEDLLTVVMANPEINIDTFIELISEINRMKETVKSALEHLNIEIQGSREFKFNFYRNGVEDEEFKIMRVDIGNLMKNFKLNLSFYIKGSKVLKLIEELNFSEGPDFTIDYSIPVKDDYDSEEDKKKADESYEEDLKTFKKEIITFTFLVNEDYWNIVLKEGSIILSHKSKNLQIIGTPYVQLDRISLF